MQQATKMLPEILNNPTPEGGAQVLSRMGVDRSFVDGIFNKYGSYASKVGLSKGTVKNALDNLGRAMDNNKPSAPDTTRQRKASGFDSSKYPKL